MANRIQLRRDTTANWNEIDPVLADGEPGYDIVTNQVRVGDGTTSWSGLSGNVIGGGGSVSQLTNGSLHATLNSDGQLVMPAAVYGVALDTTSTCVQSLNTNSYQDFGSLSGEILVNDLYDGYVYKFLVGSGKVCMLGCTNDNWNGTIAVPSASYTLAGYLTMSYPAGNTYRFTNLTSLRDFSFTVIKTRNSA